MNEMDFPVENIDTLIHTVRGQRVILDGDLARIYGVPTKRLNEQVKRNKGRFPPDFMFQLTPEEWNILKAQRTGTQEIAGNRSQIATGSSKHRDPRLLPMAFTDNGAIMSANVLNSDQAVRMSVFVVRAFLKMRELLASTTGLVDQLRAVEAKLTTRLDLHETAIVDILQRIMDLLNPTSTESSDPVPQREIGFHTDTTDEQPGDEASQAEKSRS